MLISRRPVLGHNGDDYSSTACHLEITDHSRCHDHRRNAVVNAEARYSADLQLAEADAASCWLLLIDTGISDDVILRKQDMTE
jgi:hypothetical protein